MATTTDLGIPLVDFDTDQPNGAGQMNAIAAAVDALLAERLVPTAQLRTNHAAMTGLGAGSHPVDGGWTKAYGSGDIAYASGIYTVARAGLYAWTASFGILVVSTHAATVQVLVNGSTPPNGNGSQTYYPNPIGVGSAGGHVALNAGDTVQLDLELVGSGSGSAFTPSAFGLALVG